MKMNKSINILLVVVAGSLLSCGGGHDQAIQEQKPITVSIETASIQQPENSIMASGKVEAKNSSNLSTRMMGYVNDIRVEVGDNVRKGQLLLTLNSTDLLAKKSQVEAQISQVESALENAEKDFKRFTELFQKGSASQKELDDMTTRYEMTKANLEAAQQMRKEVLAQFAYTNIRAPFDGIINNTFIKVGDMANPGMPLISIEGTEQFEVTAIVSENDIAQVREDMKARILIKSLDKTALGIVSEVSRSAKNTGGQFLVKIDMEYEGTEILPGMFVNVQMISNGSQQASTIMIPEDILVKKGQLRGIYAVGNENTAILRWLRLGKNYDGLIEVLSGLKAGEKYIVSADSKLYNGALISY